MSNEKRPSNVKKNKSGAGVGKFFFALVMAVVAFIALLVLETGVLNKTAKIAVVTAKTDIEASSDITEANISQYLTTTDFEESKIPAGAVKAEELNDKLLNAFIISDIAKGQVITDKVYISRDSITEKVAEDADSDELLETSFAIDAISDAVAGTIRRGDIVNIVVYSYPTTGEATEEEFDEDLIDKKVLENIHIKQAYDGSGNVIADDVTPATMFDIIASQDDIDQLNALQLQKLKGGIIHFTIVKTNDVAF